MSILNVDKVDPSTGTALELGTSGDTISIPSGATLDISASTLTPPATMPASSAANLTSIPAANLTGTIAAISGVNLTSLNATNLGSGTVPTARLGTGSASSSVFLAGDNTWAAAGGGLIGQVIHVKKDGGAPNTSSTVFADMPGMTLDITPVATSSRLLCIMSVNGVTTNATSLAAVSMQILADSTNVTRIENWMYNYDGAANGNICLVGVISPSTTSAVTVKGRYHNRVASAIHFNSTTNDESDLIVMEILA